MTLPALMAWATCPDIDLTPCPAGTSGKWLLQSLVTGEVILTQKRYALASEVAADWAGWGVLRYVPETVRAVP